jgi:hypothetical protein
MIKTLGSILCQLYTYVEYEALLGLNLNITDKQLQPFESKVEYSINSYSDIICYAFGIRLFRFFCDLSEGFHFFIELLLPEVFCENTTLSCIFKDSDNKRYVLSIQLIISISHDYIECKHYRDT